jgi:hypothetical protein
MIRRCPAGSANWAGAGPDFKWSLRGRVAQVCGEILGRAAKREVRIYDIMRWVTGGRIIMFRHISYIVEELTGS